jgi:hypothetical protein
MRTAGYVCLVCAAVLVAACSDAWADVQEMAPGTGAQGATVIDTGANGICETTAMPDDLQVLGVGAAPTYQAEVKCGPNKVADTTAAGDDTQLVAPGAACNNPNVAVIDTGPDGIADTTANNTPTTPPGDDVQLIPVGSAPANRPCVITGANGKADTAPPAGDDVQVLALGSVLPNQPVIRCGPNQIPETAANNVIPGGDDVQVTPVSDTATCANANTVVVDSGANGIAETRAIGPDLVLAPVNPIRVKIPRGKASVSKKVKVRVSNREWPTTTPAPPSRTYQLVVTDGSCPNGTVDRVDANASTTPLDATASVPLGGKRKGSFYVTFNVQDVTSVSRKIPFRCAVNVEADVVDPALNGAADDAALTENNSARIDLEVVDKNDLP